MEPTHFALLSIGRIFKRNGYTYTKTSHNTGRRDGESGTICTFAPHDPVEVKTPHWLIEQDIPVSPKLRQAVAEHAKALVDADLDRVIRKGELVSILDDGSVMPFACGEAVAATNPETVRTPAMDYMHPSYEQAAGRAKRDYQAMEPVSRPLWHLGAFAVGVAALVVGVIAVVVGFLFADAPMIIGGSFASAFGGLLAHRYNRRS